MTKPSRTPLVIVGAGGFGREVAWLVSDINEDGDAFELLGFLDDHVASTPEGYPVIATLDGWIAAGKRDILVACAVGDSFSRHTLVTRLEEAGHRFATLVHPSVQRSRWVDMGPGATICAGTILTTNVAIGAHCLLNLDCTVGHDTQLGDFTSFMPGVHLSGDVAVGQGAYLGTGAVVINRVRIGPWTIVGAGAVVAADLPARVTAVGVPAKALRANPRAPREDDLSSSR